MKFLLTFCLIFLSITLLAGITFDQNGKWETTFNYPECTQRGGGGATDCATVANDGTTWSWGANNVDGNYTQVSSAANMPNGQGGNGFRAWVGDGKNVYSGPIKVGFPTPQKELWIRWYMRFEVGFAWENDQIHYDKTLYIRTKDGLSTGNHVIVNHQGGDVFALIAGGTSDYYQVQTQDGAWITMNQGARSNGEWHLYEIYLKMDTNQQDGEGKIWLNGVLKADVKGVDWSNGEALAKNGWEWFDFHNNQNNPVNGRAMYVDYDDMVVYNTTPPNRDAQGNAFIGPVNTPPPVNSLPAPSNLKVTP